MQERPGSAATVGITLAALLVHFDAACRLRCLRPLPITVALEDGHNGVPLPSAFSEALEGHFLSCPSLQRTRALVTRYAAAVNMNSSAVPFCENTVYGKREFIDSLRARRMNGMENWGERHPDPGIHRRT